MQKHLFWFFILTSLTMAACGRIDEDSGEVGYLKGHWGHHDAMANLAPTSMFLIHHPAQKEYRICVANYMEEKFPGFNVELQAAASVWAHYIGRKVEIQMESLDLPYPVAGTDSDDQLDDYHQRCGNDTDLVVGLAHMQGSTLGHTNFSYSYRTRAGKREVVSFKRGLFLRIPDQGGPVKRWVSAREALGEVLGSDELLEATLKRDKKVYRYSQDESLTYSVLIHEFGHVWGLCDQYPLAGNRTNCDPDFSVLSPEGHIVLDEDSMMGAEKWPIFVHLTEDDITGIRKLAERFPGEHPGPEMFSSIEVMPLAPAKPVEYFAIKGVEKKENKIVVSLALVTGEAATLKTRLEIKNGRPVTYGGSSLSKAVKYPEFRYTLSLPYSVSVEDVSKVEMTVTVGETVLTRSITL